LGQIGRHGIVIAAMPDIGNNSAATVATQLMNDFPSIRFGLLVGIGGGVPDKEGGKDVRLGDIVVSKPTNNFGGVVQYDLGKVTTHKGFEQTGALNKPPTVLRANVETLAAQHRREGNRVPHFLSEMVQKFPRMKEEYIYPGLEHDRLFKAVYVHQGGRTCDGCDTNQLVQRTNRRGTDPKIHYGTIGSANAVIKDSAVRDQLRTHLKVICVEMEAAGLMDTFPCLVIRGICDYADSHKNDQWHPYAAATAAAYAKELLMIIPSKEVKKESQAAEVLQSQSEYV